jgi:hypothetical protein
LHPTADKLLRICIDKKSREKLRDNNIYQSAFRHCLKQRAHYNVLRSDRAAQSSGCRLSCSVRHLLIDRGGVALDHLAHVTRGHNISACVTVLIGKTVARQ